MRVGDAPVGDTSTTEDVVPPESDGRRADDVDAFLVRRHGPMLRLARVLTGHPQQAEDLMQDVLATVLVKWRRVSAADDPVAYTNRMLVNAVSSWGRRPARRESAAVIDDDRLAADPASPAEARLAVVAALRTLSPRHRAVLALRYLEDWTDDDIAEVLGITPSTVRSCARRGLAALRASGALDGYDVAARADPGDRPARVVLPSPAEEPLRR